MQSIEALIVEDELLIAETIKLYLNERGHAVVGIAISYQEAIQLLTETKPDIILLDIRLYGQKSGIDVANHLLELESKIPYIIVSSQFDSKIIKEATLAGAAGYITKPISKETLWSTIELAVLQSKDAISKEQYVELKIGHDLQRIKTKDILYIKSDHVYVEIICETDKYVCRYSLTELLGKINQPNFVRCHRSYIVNTKKIQKYSSSKVWIKDEVIPVSSSYREAIAKSKE